MTPETCNSPDTSSNISGTEEAQAANVALLPCPHCGEQEQLYPAYRMTKDGSVEPPYAIDCLGCGTDFTPRDGMDARTAWNRRAAPALPQDVAALVERFTNQIEAALGHANAEKPYGLKGIPSVFELQVGHLRDIGTEMVAALRSQSSTIASARGVIEQLLPAAEKVLEGLHARIDAAENSAVPVFYGISALSDAINAARDWKER